MDKIRTKIIIFFLPFIFTLSLTLFAQPSEENLVKAWEMIQKNDPETVVFEKLEENIYF